jgi:hypothetical protein
MTAQATRTPKSRPGVGPAHVMPWWACLICVLACLGVYICRIILTYRLGSKALDKAGPAQVPAVMEAVAGGSSPRRWRSG